MRFHASHISTSIAGDYSQLMFKAERDTGASDSPYLLLQPQFETPGGGECYIETHDEAYRGHFRLCRIEFTPVKLSIELDRPTNNVIDVTFDITIADFRQASRVVKTIRPSKIP
nr:hypothetical protein [uncultured Rhodopila sp.]